MIPQNGFYRVISTVVLGSSDTPVPTGTTAITVSAGVNASHAHLNLKRETSPGNYDTQTLIIAAGLPFNLEPSVKLLNANNGSVVGTPLAGHVTFLKYNLL